jgi:recombinational DNA repair protein (RecF pathway)
MQEYISKAIVFKKQQTGDLDNRYTLFTERFGKIVVNAKSARKITSKLAGHLEPGIVTNVRIIEKNGLRIADSLKERILDISINNLSLLSDILPEWENDLAVWNFLISKKFDWVTMLKILGWDPYYAECAECGSKDVSCFYTKTQDFFCSSCKEKKFKNNKFIFENLVELNY